MSDLQEDLWRGLSAWLDGSLTTWPFRPGEFHPREHRQSRLRVSDWANPPQGAAHEHYMEPYFSSLNLFSTCVIFLAIIAVPIFLSTVDEDSSPRAAFALTVFASVLLTTAAARHGSADPSSISTVIDLAVRFAAALVFTLTAVAVTIAIAVPAAYKRMHALAVTYISVGAAVAYALSPIFR